MKITGLFGIASIAIGGSFLVYVLSSVIINAYRQSSNSSELSTLLMLSVYGGLIAFFLIGTGFWLIVNSAEKTRVVYSNHAS
jgi:hypothetical protein